MKTLFSLSMWISYLKCKDICLYTFYKCNLLSIFSDAQLLPTETVSHSQEGSHVHFTANVLATAYPTEFQRNIFPLLKF